MCVDREDGGLPGAVGVCVWVRSVCAWVHLCGCVGGGDAGQTLTASARLVGSAMTGSSSTEQHRTETRVLL